MLSRFLLIVGGIFTGMWMRDPSGSLYGIGFPVLAVLSLLLAVATTPSSMNGNARTQLADAYRQWLEAWHRLQSAGERERAGVDEALRLATLSLAINANGVVIKSLRRATEQDLEPAAVAQLTLDVRRNLRSGGVALRAADLEPLLASLPRSGTSGRVGNVRPAAPSGATAASFLL